MDIRSLYLEYVEKLKEKKEFNVWTELWQHTKHKKCYFGITAIIAIIAIIIICYKYVSKITCIYLIFLISISIVFLILVVFSIFLLVNKNKMQVILLKSYNKYSDDRKRILNEILNDKDTDSLIKIKSEIEKLKEEIDIFAYPIKIKSITGYIALGSVILYGSFFMSISRFYCEKKLEENLTIDNLIFIIFIGLLIIIFVVFPIIIIIDFFSTIYSFCRLRYYNYLIGDLNDTIIFNKDFQNKFNSLKNNITLE